jgi:hypothetical protein
MELKNINWGGLLSVSKESTITSYRELYLRNKKNVKYELKQIIDELIKLKRSTLFYDLLTEDALSALDSKTKILITDTFVLSEYGKITKEYLKQQKEFSFDKNKPEIERTNNLGSLMEGMRLLERDTACAISTQEFINTAIPARIKALSDLIQCIEDYGLHPFILEREVESALYNLYILYTDRKGKEKKDALVLLKKEELQEQYITPYLKKDLIMFNGTIIKYENIQTIRVSKGLQNNDEAPLFYSKSTYGTESFYPNSADSRVRYFGFCENVTKEFINTSSLKIDRVSYDYIFRDRMIELEATKNKDFDLTKLIQLCKELNIANEKGLLFAKAALVRAICDHIPPIFGFNSFEQVAANYNSDKNSRSFKGAVKGLYEFFKHVADGVMHSQARKKESLPTSEQLDVSKELDFLLQEVCRLLK